MINATIDGYMATDPEKQGYGQDGKSFVKFTLPQSWKDRDGKETTWWIRATVFGRTGENLLKYKRKSDYIIVSGELTGRVWMSNDGEREEKELKVDRVSYGPRTEPKPQQSPRGGYGGGKAAPADDIPF